MAWGAPPKRSPSKAKKSKSPGHRRGSFGRLLADTKPAGINNSALASSPQRNLAAASRRLASRRAPATVGQTVTATGDRLTGATLTQPKRNVGWRTSSGLGANPRSGRTAKIGVTKDGKIVHLYGSGRGADRVVLNKKAPASMRRRAASSAFKNAKRKRLTGGRS